MLPLSLPSALLVHDLPEDAVSRLRTAFAHAGIALVAHAVAALTTPEDVNALEEADLLVGHGWGGPVVLRLAEMHARAKAVALVGSPVPEGTCPPAVLPICHPDEMKSVVERLGKPLLLLHAPLDEEVDIDHAARYFSWAKHPKSYISLHPADHMLSGLRDAAYVARVISAWASPWMETHAEPEPNVVMARTPGGTYRTDMWVKGHHLVADEPEAVGGNNLGPSPSSLMAASLAACTSMTLRMYADRKQWPLEAATVYVAHKKVPSQDPARPGKVDWFGRVVHLEGPLDDSQRERIMQIADRCPVHKALHSESIVETRLEPTETPA